MTDDDELLTTSDVEDRYKILKKSLRSWRRHQIGPPYILLAPRVIRYSRRALEEWLATREKKAG